MPHTTGFTTIAALSFMLAGLGVLMLATVMWCLTLGTLLAATAVRRPLRVMAGARS